MRPRAAMVFAAGFGTRMAPLTDTLPKPLIPAAGRPLIDHALDLLVESRIAEAVVNTHYRAEMLERHLAGRAAPRVQISREATLLDTGGGLKAALPLLRPLLGEGPVVTLNSDAVWQGPNPLTALLAAWGAVPKAGALLSLVPRERALGHRGAGDFFLDGDGRLRFRDGADAAPYVYTGAQVIEAGPVAAEPGAVFSLTRIWRALAAEGRLFGAVWPGRWVDVGHPESLEIAAELLG